MEVIIQQPLKEKSPYGYLSYSVSACFVWLKF